MNKYYVYAWLRDNGTPYYIGKGEGRRAYRHHGEGWAQRPTDRTRIIILEQGMAEDDALALEARLIKEYGRKSDGTGCLRNQQEGGTQPPVNTGHSEETRRKIRKSNKKTAEKRDYSYLKGVPKKNYKDRAGMQEKLRQSRLGKLWWNDGTREVKSATQPEGFVRGRLRRRSSGSYENIR